MKKLPPSLLVRAGAGIILSFVTVGCATSSDLDKLYLDLNSRLKVQTRTIQAETSRMRDETKAFRTEMGELRSEVDTFHAEMKKALDRLNEQEIMTDQIVKKLNMNSENTRRAMEGYGTKSLERFGKIEAMTGEASKQLQVIQHAVSDSNGRIQQLPSLVSTLGTEIHSLTTTLLGSYELEEAALKDRLRTIEQMKKRLSPLEAEE